MYVSKENKQTGYIVTTLTYLIVFTCAYLWSNNMEFQYMIIDYIQWFISYLAEQITHIIAT